MSPDEAPGNYWVNLYTEGVLLGVGFYVTRRYIITAEHCLKGLPEDRRDVTLRHADGSEAFGSVCERLKDADLALLRLVGDPHVSPPPADRGNMGDRWRTPSRPTASDPHLVGAVEEPSTRFECVGGAEVEALQLRTEAQLGDYSGYSGSAIERVGAAPRIVGILQEQYLDRADEKRASNVLFAATIREAIDRFHDYFDTRGLNSVFPPIPVPAVAAGPRRGEGMDVAATLDRLNAVLEQAADWAARGLIASEDVRMIQINVARTVVEESAGRGDR